ncbi:type II toxin-antitoxin system PemK/MazF family toxin [Spirosoma validum]|uniref:mRNA interferase n=1 Tax=Spirosoma validum TaxID=2771355 RepID=A0A927AXV7_9BACT|nr:type II toxin-antitoxin system PemK/MazF family toxin [Spirosoma validum]MBD2751768.1 type II toxin-antitoxin system PemK/MazF family toxin [Spirosoma validum]
MVINQYAVILVNLDPTIGSEVKKTRPCVVVSPDEMNRQVNTLIIAPMTSTSKAYPSRIQVQSGGRVGWVMLDQIRAIDRLRVIKVLGNLSTSEMVKIKQVIKELFVD